MATAEQTRDFVSSINLPDEQATETIGAAIAPLVRSGDILRLEGPLGAGKTTLARAVIRALCEVDEAPSPTFTLVETYQAGAFLLWHFDLYRLEQPSDIYELGIEECLEDGAALIEWPDKAGNLLPPGGLGLSIALAGGRRTLHLTADTDWSARLRKAGIV